ncbi:MAG TPA: ribosome-binding factor A [Candidatus Babeliales bacterium]|jgi:ribosome-binding factor A|nr:ribosome-binding factor A [Candidatus Babeliales bacterium]
MSSSTRQREIKHAQRESFLLREISTSFWQITQDEPRLAPLYVDHVQLSPDGSRCLIFFYCSQGGEPLFQELMPLLILYKPSMRTALAKASSSKYVPQLQFVYAGQVEKQRRVEELIDTLKKEGKL